MISSVCQDDWKTVFLQNRGVDFGWCGQWSPNIVEQGDLIVTLDGHIYNGREFGQPYDSDAQLVGDLYRRYGFQGTVERLNGDFAISLHDRATQTTWLARDRFGVKPLYYANGSTSFAFSSRPRALLTLPYVTNTVNQAFIARFAGSHYRYFDNAPHESPYRDIAQLPAAHLLCIKDAEVTTIRYWSIQDLTDLETPVAELAIDYRDLLLDAVAVRLKAARHPVFSLSGGMDSSSVLASAVKLTGQRQQAISTVYEDSTYDESDDIQSMLETHVSEWHPVNIGTPNVIDLIQKMVRDHDEPVATATWLAHYVMCQSVTTHGFDSLFGGLGGDELNAGEYEYFTFFFADLHHKKQMQSLREEVSFWEYHHDHPIFKKNFGAMERNLRKLTEPAHPGRCLPDLERLHRYDEAISKEFYDLSNFEPVMDHPFSSYLKNRTYQDLTRETLPCCLRAEDRQTSAFGLDHFLPFLDYRLVEFMFRIPNALKIHHGVTKVLLREALTDILPTDTRQRIKKTGWNAPAHLWLSGQGRDLVLDLGNSQRFKERGLYNITKVQMLINEHDELVNAGNREDNHMMFLWQLVNLELWLRYNEDCSKQDH